MFSPLDSSRSQLSKNVFISMFDKCCAPETIFSKKEWFFNFYQWGNNEKCVFLIFIHGIIEIIYFRLGFIHDFPGFSGFFRVFSGFFWIFSGFFKKNREKFWKNPGKLWKILKNPGKSWKILKNPEKSWKNLEKSWKIASKRTYYWEV